MLTDRPPAQGLARGVEARLTVDGEWYRGEAAGALVEMALVWRKSIPNRKSGANEVANPCHHRAASAKSLMGRKLNDLTVILIPI